MNDRIANVAYNVLQNLSRAEVSELVEILEFYNTKCKEESRAACLRHGCKNQSHRAERQIKEAVEKYQESASSQDIYFSITNDRCPCCGR